MQKQNRIIRNNKIQWIIWILLFSLSVHSVLAISPRPTAQQKPDSSDEALAKPDLPIEALVKQDLSAEALAKPDLSAEALAKADSLYTAKQYTQAFELYMTLRERGQYAPAMLLKMAHIQEGLDHLGESLYYLDLYFLASDDTQALKKMEELAKKNNLEGYETSESTHLLAWLQGQYVTIARILSSVGLFLLAVMYYLRVKKNLKPSFAGLAMVCTMTLLFIHINFSKTPERGIVARPQTYLMSGPSAGASVVAIIGEGHQLEITGKKDVWLKVRWKEDEVFVKENLVKPVRL